MPGRARRRYRSSTGCPGIGKPDPLRGGIIGEIYVQPASCTCIPEIVAKSLMPHLSREYNIPVLTLFIDEQTGSTATETRLEAFVDLMLQRRERKRELADQYGKPELPCSLTG